MSATLPNPSGPPPPSEQVNGPLDSSEYNFNIECLNFYTLEGSVTIQRSSHETAAEGLVRNGYLGASPDRPTLVVSLKTLELFYDIRRVKASFSVEAFTKLLCYKYFVCSSLICLPWTYRFPLGTIPAALSEGDLGYL